MLKTLCSTTTHCTPMSTTPHTRYHLMSKGSLVGCERNMSNNFRKRYVSTTVLPINSFNTGNDLVRGVQLLSSFYR